MRIPGSSQRGEVQNEFGWGWETAQFMIHTIYEPAFDDGTGRDIIQSTVDEYIRRRSRLSQNYINISTSDKYYAENNKGIIEVRFGNYDDFLEYIGDNEVVRLKEYRIPVVINLNGYEDERGEFPSFGYAINADSLKRYIKENTGNSNVVAYIENGSGQIWDNSIVSGNPYEDIWVILSKLGVQR